MTTFNISILNTIDILGGSPSSIWGSYNWLAFRWGTGTVPLIWSLDHLVGSSLTIDSGTSSKGLETHTGSSITLDSAIIKETSKFIAESLTPLSEMTLESVLDANGYYYVYVPNTTNAENRAIGNYTSNIASSISWVCNSSGSLTWS